MIGSDSVFVCRGVASNKEGNGHAEWFVEAQCCRVKPGTRTTVITGCGSDALRDCVNAVVGFVANYEEDVSKEMGLAGHSLRLRPAGTDLHVHMVDCWAVVAPVNLKAAVTLALMALMLGRKLKPGIGAFGDVSLTGVCSTAAEWDEADVQSCRDQGIRQLVVPHSLELSSRGLELAAKVEQDGKQTLEFFKIRRVMEALKYALV